MQASWAAAMSCSTSPSRMMLLTQTARLVARLRGIRRSISIFDGKKGELVWDSGDFIEKFTADPANGVSHIFNSEGGENPTPLDASPSPCRPFGISTASSIQKSPIFSPSFLSSPIPPRRKKLNVHAVFSRYRVKHRIIRETPCFKLDSSSS